MIVSLDFPRRILMVKSLRTNMFVFSYFIKVILASFAHDKYVLRDNHQSTGRLDHFFNC